MSILLIALLLKGGGLMNGEIRKFAGVGLINLLSISVFVMVAIVVTKTILIKHPVTGVTEFVSAI